MRHLFRFSANIRRNHLLLRHYKAAKAAATPSPATPPKPPKKPQKFSFHGVTWEDEYSWMSNLSDKVAMRHMDVYMEQEEKYTEAVMFDTERLQDKLHSEMASRMAFDLSTPPLRWGPWLYYRRAEEGKQYPVLCRRLASLNDEFISHKHPSAGFDFTTGKRIEQKLVDYNQEAERFGGYAYEELSEVSPNHLFIAYTMYDKDTDYFKLSVRNLNSGSLCSKPQADRVSNLAWAKDGQTLLYVVTDQKKRPYRIYYSLIGSTDEDVLLLEESDENVYLNIRHTKDFRFVTVNSFSITSSKVFLINAADPLSGLKLVWECDAQAHCIIEHHHGYLYLFTDAPKGGQSVDYHYLLSRRVDDPSNPRKWEEVFVDDQDFIIQDIDFSDKYLALIVREGRNLQLCSVGLPLSFAKGAVKVRNLDTQFLSLPKHVCQISPGPNYDFYSSIMRFIISSPVMPDAVVDYDLATGRWNIIQQQNMLRDRTRVLYGTDSASISMDSSNSKCSSPVNADLEDDQLWNDLFEFYAYDKKPGILHGHGAYGELLDKRWRSELKSLLDRGWVVAYADVRGGGGHGKKWHHDGRRTKKHNSINDYISCAKFLIERGIVDEDKLAGWGYSAGGLLVASAINRSPDLFRAAVLKVPFLDATNTLLHPILPLQAVDYEEFGYPGDLDDFLAIREYSPYDNIQKDVLYPAVLVTSTFTTRFGVWEAAKWVARVRDLSIYDPTRPTLLNLTTDIVEENLYLQSKESALEAAFLIKMMKS
ncbi:putative oligopeptidase B [Lupinus albus]|uniref:Prolyl endopeptidase n=1 Tax=Lupinus albus TaxID=3870 RepID=A0A6A4P742_LUPAL|nr:putative oligopeptidase B [Lupinus albus]